ncbi:hypothetical protein IG631_22949 [Alternaria alternata]|nr:hypothetical protein IG631_22949 [Alternaria alternata]
MDKASQQDSKDGKGSILDWVSNRRQTQHQHTDCDNRSNLVTRVASLNAKRPSSGTGFRTNPVLSFRPRKVDTISTFPTLVHGPTAHSSSVI